jgi:predicted Zn-dependent protease with MMP-like domain
MIVAGLRGGNGSGQPESNRMTRKQFEKLVAEAVNGLPEAFLARLDNVDIVVEEFPSQEIIEFEELESPYDLLGYYEGVPLTERDAINTPWLPDRITIFQAPLEALCSSRAELYDEIQTTIVHEVAHFFGLDEDRIAELGWD